MRCEIIYLKFNILFDFNVIFFSVFTSTKLHFNKEQFGTSCAPVKNLSSFEYEYVPVIVQLSKQSH